MENMSFTKNPPLGLFEKWWVSILMIDLLFVWSMTDYMRKQQSFRLKITMVHRFDKGVKRDISKLVDSFKKVTPPSCKEGIQVMVAKLSTKDTNAFPAIVREYAPYCII